VYPGDDAATEVTLPEPAISGNEWDRPMLKSMHDSTTLLFDAIAFAARAHKHQVRKDGLTPYVSHVFRVCLVVRQVFGIDDPKVLMAAVLHDTIEDTTTDYDDLAERFGSDVASWVALLSKDTRLPDPEREPQYLKGLQTAPWQVKACKLADMYDNLGDSKNQPPEKRKRTGERVRMYVDGLRHHLPPELREAFALVEARLNEAAS
jgi:(p)ppGpp synthase/HD superfamily hydrolase